MKKNKLILSTLGIFMAAGSSFAQTEKYVVVEEKTGTWCGFCPSGTVMMAELEKNEPNFIGIAIHGGDPMQNSFYNSKSSSLPGYDNGVPFACVDRNMGGSVSKSANFYNQLKTDIPVANVEVGGEVNGNELTINISAVFDQAVAGDWRLAAIVTEDGVTGSSSSYAQVNYYSGGGYGSLIGAGREWHNSPNPVPASESVYDHVARVVANNAYDGDEESLPESIEAGSTHTYSYTVNLNPKWNIDNMHVVAMLIEPDGSINNARQSSVGLASIDEVDNKAFSINAYPNPVTDVVNLSINLNSGNEVTLEVVNIVGETVANIGTQKLSAGVHYNEIDLSDVADGVYFVKTTVNNKVETTKIVVQR